MFTIEALWGLKKQTKTTRKSFNSAYSKFTFDLQHLDFNGQEEGKLIQLLSAKNMLCFLKYSYSPSYQLYW